MANDQVGDVASHRVICIGLGALEELEPKPSADSAAKEAMKAQIGGQRKSHVQMGPNDAEETVQSGGHHGREDAANREDGDGHDEEAQGIGQEVLAREGHPKEQQMTRLVAHLEEGGQGKQKIGRAVQGTEVG